MEYHAFLVHNKAQLESRDVTQILLVDRATSFIPIFSLAFDVSVRNSFQQLYVSKSAVSLGVAAFAGKA